MRTLRWAMVRVYVLLDLVMNRPAYFLIADIDLMGGSTSWYRAELIHSTIAHIDEWWLIGTDYDPSLDAERRDLQSEPDRHHQPLHRHGRRRRHRR